MTFTERRHINPVQNTGFFIVYQEKIKPPPFQLAAIPKGRDGVRVTLRVMAKIVEDSKRRPAIREQAREIVAGVGNKNYLGEIRAVFDWVRSSIRYTRDIRGIETLHTPEKIIENAAGDCDDQSILCAALLETLGHETRFVAVGFQRDRFSHVFCQVKFRDKWITLETTENWSLGTTAPGIIEKMYQAIR